MRDLEYFSKPCRPGSVVLQTMALAVILLFSIPALLAQDNAGREPAAAPASEVGPYLPHAAESGAGSGSAAGGTTIRALEPAPQSLLDGPLFSVDHGLFEARPVGSLADQIDSIWFHAPVDQPQTPVESPPSGTRAQGTRAPGDFVREFEGQGPTNWIPPDPIIGVGPEHVVQGVNSGFRIFSKLGRTIQNYTTFQTFFSSVTPTGWNGTMFDPKVIYLRASNNPTTSGRWLMLILGRDTAAQTSHFFIAVSRTNDPTRGWWLYRFDNTFANGGDSDAWLDYCGLGGDNWGIYVTCNLFLWTGGFKHSKLHSLNPAMFEGGSSNGWAFWNLEWPSGASAFTLQPALPHSIAGGDETFWVNTFSSSGDKVLLWTMTGDRTSSPSLSKAEVAVPTYSAIGQNVGQPGSATDIDGGDTRVLHAAYNQRRVFATLTTDVGGSGNSSAAYTMKINVDSADLEWSHTLGGATDQYTFYPAITFRGASSSSDNIGIIASFSSEDPSFERQVSAVYKIYEDQPNSSAGPFVIFENGEAAYVNFDSNNRNRWGDYTGAHYDWTCGHLWGAAEVAGTGNQWRTRIRALTFGDESPCTILDVTTPADNETFTGLTSEVLAWSRLNVPSGASLSLDLSLDGGASIAETIATGLPSTATGFNWLVTDTPSNQARIRVRASSGETDWSDGVFTINPCPDDGFEPDNVCFGKRQTVGTTESHDFCNVDWKWFTPEPGKTYQIFTSGLSGGADTVLELRQSCSLPLATDDDGGAGDASRIEWTAGSGAALDIRISAKNGRYRAGQSYELTISECDSNCELIFRNGYE